MGCVSQKSHGSRSTFRAVPFKALLLLSFGVVIAHAEQITFFFGSDPQYQFYGIGIKTGHTDPTMHLAALLLSRCEDCTKVFPIMGDLTHDGDGQSEYESAYLTITKSGVKILDGLGNHDLKQFSDIATAFNNEDSLFRVLPGKRNPLVDAALMRQAEQPFRNLHGWEPFHFKAFKVDRDTASTTPCGTFNATIESDYCKASGSGALYYTMALTRPFTFQKPAVAYLVQLHNAMQSNTAVDYLRLVKQELTKRGELAKPVILVGHQLAGSNKADFKDLVKEMM